MPDTTTSPVSRDEETYILADAHTGEMIRIPEAQWSASFERIRDALSDGPHRTAPTNVVEALARVIEEMPNIGKDQQMNAPGQKYNYRSIEVIAAIAGRLLGRYGIVIKAHKIKREFVPIQKGSGAGWTRDTVKVRYRIYGPGWQPASPTRHETYDFIDTGWFTAIADDNSDKGVNKAMTQARKQMLIDLLQIGDNADDADSYHVANSDAPGQPAPASPPIPWEQVSGWTSEEAIAAGNQSRARLKDLADSGTITKDEATEWWNRYITLPEGRSVAWKEDHDGWTAAFDSFITKRGGELGAAESHGSPGTAPAEPEPAAEPQKPTEAPHKADGDVSAWPDNSYRSSLDMRYHRDGIDALQKALTAMSDDRLTTGLTHRGVPEFDYETMDIAAKRRTLGLIIVRNDRNGPPENPVTGDPAEENDPENAPAEPGETRS